MEASDGSAMDVSGHDFRPDGRQMRIDFFTFRGKENDQESGAKGFDWWNQITSWFKSGRSNENREIEDFISYLNKRNYSEKTRKSYMYMLKKFFAYLDDIKASRISYALIEDYNYEFFVSGRYSRSYQLQFINSLSLYLEFIEGRKVNLKGLRKSRKPENKA